MYKWRDLFLKFTYVILALVLLEVSKLLYIDGDDDEVRRVCKTPGNPFECTRQHSQRSGLPLPSP